MKWLAALQVKFKQEVQELGLLTLDDLELTAAGRWPVSLKALVFLGLIAGSFYASQAWLMADYPAKLAAAKQEETALDAALSQTQAEVAQLKTYAEEAANEASTQENQGFLPANSQLTPLLAALEQEASNQQLSLTQLALMPEVALAHYTRLPLVLEAQGSYHQLASYLASLGNFQPWLSLHNFSLETISESPNQLKLNLELQAYRLADNQAANPAQTEAQQTPAVNQPAALPLLPNQPELAYQLASHRDPFAPVSQVNLIANLDVINHPLESYELNQLTFRGSMHKGEQSYALVLTEDKVLYKLSLGSKLGKQQGELVGLTSQELIIKEYLLEGSQQVETLTRLPAFN